MSNPRLPNPPGPLPPEDGWLAVEFFIAYMGVTIKNKVKSWLHIKLVMLSKDFPNFVFVRPFGPS